MPTASLAATAIPLPANELHLFDPDTGVWHHGRISGGTLSHVMNPRWDASLDWETLTGDVNGDGRADLLGRRLDNGDWWAAVNDGTGGYRTSFWGSWASGGPFHDVTVDDFNGDGRDDLLGRTSTGEWRVGLSDGTRFSTQSVGRWNADGWLRVLHGDINGDGLSDVVGQFSSGDWYLSQSNGSRFVTTRIAHWSPTGWAHVVAGDFNGDGRDDLAGLTATGQWWEAIASETGFSTRYAGRWTTGTPYRDLHVGDFDGDGRDEIAARTDLNRWYLTNNRDATTGSLFRTYWGSWNFRTGWSHITVGDYDNDGRQDITGYLPGSGLWYVLYSQGAYFGNSLVGGWGPGVG